MAVSQKLIRSSQFGETGLGFDNGPLHPQQRAAAAFGSHVANLPRRGRDGFGDAGGGHLRSRLFTLRQSLQPYDCLRVNRRTI